MLNELLNIKYPVIQGGMAQIATGEFAATVSNAGGLGLIASGGFTADLLRQHIKTAKSLTDKPFGVNILLLHNELEAVVDVVIEEKVAVVTTGAGDASPYIPMLKEAGIKVFPVIPSVALALRMERAGADAVIAEGTEAGGHIGELTTMALLPQVCDAVSIPVIAAGGIGSGRQMLAAFVLGAVGVQIGTLFLASEECPIHENYKQALVAARDTSTAVTGRNSGAPVRLIKNRMAREYLKREKEGGSLEELELFTLGSLRRAVFEGDSSTGSLMAGQVVGQIKDIRPLVQILDTLWAEYGDALDAVKLL